MDSLVRLTGLSGLRQAVFVLQCIDEGKTQNELAKICDGDEQLVTIWTEFMLELKWLEKKKGAAAVLASAGSVAVTEPGKEAIKKYLYSQRDAGMAQKDVQNRPVSSTRFKMPATCATCSAVATMELVTEMDEIMTVEKICDMCFIAGRYQP